MSLYNGENVYPLLAQFVPIGKAGLGAGSIAIPPLGATEGALWYNFNTKRYQAIINGVVVDIAGFNIGAPGGANTQVQFNDSGVFGGNASFLYNKTTGRVNLTAITAPDNGSGTLNIPNGNIICTLTDASAVCIDTSTICNTPRQLITVSSSATNQSSTTNVNTITAVQALNAHASTAALTKSACLQIATTVIPSGGALTTSYGVEIVAPTYGASSGGVTTQAALIIGDNTDTSSGLAGTNCWGIKVAPQTRSTNSFALEVQGGKTQLTPNVDADTALRILKHSATQSAPALNADGFVTLSGLTSGSASLGVPAVAGTPNQLNLPTTTGTAGQVLVTDGGSPQQLSWVTDSGIASAVGSTGFKDDFLGSSVAFTDAASLQTTAIGATTSFLMGDTPWFTVLIGGGTPTVGIAADTFTNPGQLNFVTGSAATGNGLTVYKSRLTAASVGALGSNANWEGHFIFAFQGAATTRAVRLGFMIGGGNPIADPVTDGIYAEFDTANTGNTDTNITLVTRAASVSSYAASAVAPGTTFHHVRIRSLVAGTIRMQVDGGTEVTLATNVPTVNLTPVIQLLTRTTATAAMFLDFASYVATTGRT